MRQAYAEYAEILNKVPTAQRSYAVAGVDQDCYLCGGQGWIEYNVPAGHPEFGKLHPCECTSSTRAQILQSLSGLTDHERLVTLDQINVLPYSDCRRCHNTRRILSDASPVPVPCPDCYNGTAEMVQATARLISNPFGILTIEGKSGNAKSMALWAAINAMLSRSVMAVYVIYADLLDYIREAYREDGESDYSRLKKFMDVPFLAIDEAGHDKAGTVTPWVMKQESRLFDLRYRHGLAGLKGTIIAMNDSVSKLPDHIASRLGDGRNVNVTNNDPDLRPYMRGTEVRHG